MMRSIVWTLAIAASGLVLCAVSVGQRGETLIGQRAITPRGDFGPDEKRTVDIFERCSRSVVYVSPLVTRRRATAFGYRSFTETGTGSGFVWDQAGHIVTNYHVIRSATGCLVTLADNSVHEARLVGEWPDKDVAVLKIDAPAERLFPIPLGTSRDLRVGQTVLAIGNPYALDFTLTTGIVSALNREIESVTKRPIFGVIQTDAAINPGNSGGPLLDSAGRLIGINTAIYTQSGSSAGIGFAVPVDTINRVVPQLITYGKVIRPSLAATFADDFVARRLNLDGVLVLSVRPEGPADAAGIRPTTETPKGEIELGDVIVGIGGKAVRNVEALLDALAAHEVGETVDVTVKRDGRETAVPVRLGPEQEPG